VFLFLEAWFGRVYPFCLQIDLVLLRRFHITTLLLTLHHQTFEPYNVCQGNTSMFGEWQCKVAAWQIGCMLRHSARVSHLLG
jgi:hypothetical protein